MFEYELLVQIKINRMVICLVQTIHQKKQLKPSPTQTHKIPTQNIQILFTHFESLIYKNNYPLPMFKLLTILLLFTSLLALFALITSSPFYQDFTVYRRSTTQQPDQGQMLETSQYEKLQELMTYPILGQYYAQRLIQEMLRRKLFEEVITSSVVALESIVNRRSYKIWFYKATAECKMLQLVVCRKSLYNAQALAPLSYYDQLQNLLEVFNMGHQSRLSAMRMKLQSI